MSDPIKLQVPAASSGKGIQVPTSVLGNYGDVLKEDGQEAVTFGTGGLFTTVVDPAGAFVQFYAVGETGDDTATITDEGVASTVELTVTTEAPETLQLGPATIVTKTTPAAGSGTAGAGVA